MDWIGLEWIGFGWGYELSMDGNPKVNTWIRG